MIKKFGAGILGLIFAFGAFGASALTVEAKNNKDKDQRHRRWDRDRDWRRNNDDDRRWRERNRRNDRLRGRGYNNGRYGYPGNNNGRYGNGRYNNGGYGNYGNSNELNRGYQQGLSTGSSDARRGQSYSPERSRHYRNASSQEFLQGFVRGYEQGYRQYAGYNNGGYGSNSGSIWSQILGVPFN